MYKTTKNMYLSSLIALLCAFAVCIGSMSAYALDCEEVRSEVLRLHVIANSDSEHDQNIKLLVRDSLLQAGADCFSGAVSVQQAAEAVLQPKQELTAVADAVLAEHGVNYRAQIRVQTEYFETRTYEDVTLPAGHYLAVCVILGEGQGKNWWCVMFPPLCLPVATQNATEYAVFSETDNTVIAAEDGYEIRFKIVEWFEALQQKIREKTSAE